MSGLAEGTLRFKYQRGSLEVARTSGFAEAAGRTQYLTREVFARGLQSLPDAASAGGYFAGYSLANSAKVEISNVELDPFCAPGHQVG